MFDEKTRRTIVRYWQYVAGGNYNHTYCRNIVAWLESNTAWRESVDGCYWHVPRYARK